jgi:hypothetical protein
MSTTVATRRSVRPGVVVLWVVQVLLAGAIITNLFVLGASPVIPLAYLLVAGVVAWFRRPGR